MRVPHIWLASYPRSGNTLVRHAIEALYGLATLSIYPERSDEFCPVLGSPNYWPRLVIAPVSVVKTHSIQHADTIAPAIFVVRDGRDTIISHAHYEMICGWSYENGVTELDYVIRCLITGAVPALNDDTANWNWSNSVSTWLARAAQTEVVRYEDLIRDPFGVVRETMLTLGLNLRELDDPRLPPFCQLQKQRPAFYRRGLVGSWMDEMSEELHELFWQYHGTTMVMLGYDRTGHIDGSGPEDCCRDELAAVRG